MAGFQEARDRVLDIVIERKAWEGKFYAGRLGHIATRVSPDLESVGVQFGTYSIDRPNSVTDFDAGQDTTNTAVHTTDFRVEPPVTRLLIPTGYGNFVGIFEGRMEELQDQPLAELHAADTAIGKMVIADIHRQLELIPSVQTVMSLN